MPIPKVSFAIRLSPDVYAAIRKAAAAAGQSMTQWVEAALRVATEKKK